MVTQISWREVQRARTTVKGSGNMAWQRGVERMLHVTSGGGGVRRERSRVGQFKGSWDVVEGWSWLTVED
jgi:hypothetical protein